MQESCSRPGSARGINSSPNNDVKGSVWDALSQQSGTLAEPGQPNRISLEGKEMSSSKRKCCAKSSMASHRNRSIGPEASVSPSKWEDKDVYHHLDYA